MFSLCAYYGRMARGSFRAYNRRLGDIVSEMIFNFRLFYSPRADIVGHGTSTSRQTLTSSLQSSWLMRRGNGDARSSGADHHHHGIASLGLGVGGGRGVGGSGKGCATPQCSWRLLAIALLLTCGLLAAALAYFTGKLRLKLRLWS